MGGIVGAVADIVGLGPASKQADATKDAASKSADAQRYAADIQNQMFQQQIALQKPWHDAGEQSINRLSAGLQPGGEFSIPFSKTNWKQDPGYAFRLQQGMDAMNQQAAARGGLISGNALKAAQRYGQDMGSQEYQNAFNRYYAERDNMLRPLQSVAGIGQSSATTMGNSAAGYGNNVSNLAMMNAANQGNAALSLGNIRASQYGNIGRALDEALSTDWGGVSNKLGNLFSSDNDSMWV